MINPPNAGQGLHEWVLKYTRAELAKGREETKVRAAALALCQGKGRKESILSREIDDAIAGAVKWLGEHPEAKGRLEGSARAGRSFGWWNAQLRGSLRHPPTSNRWIAPVDHKLIRVVLRRIRRLRLEPYLPDATDFDLGILYGGINFPVCLAERVNVPVSKYLSDWGDRWGRCQWMVPNPCLRCGVGGGVKSYANAGERIWLIVEFDQYDLEDQAKLLVWLGKIWQSGLGMIVYSGSKSLHGWFSCVGASERYEICKFFKTATRLGCDQAMRSQVQYTRMPLGRNAKTLRQQEILHYDEDRLAEHKGKLVETYTREISEPDER